MLAVPGAAALMCLVAFSDPAVVTDRLRGVIKHADFGQVHVDFESIQAATDEGEAAYLAAKEVLGLPGIRFNIVDPNYTSSKWGDLSPDGAPIYVWPFAKGSNGRATLPPSNLLRHEIGHDLFIRYLVPSTKVDQYGGDAPDWLDEMAAVAFEGEAQLAMRRRATVRYAKEAKLIPLRHFLTMTHPEMTAGPLPTSSGQDVPVFEALSKETPQFYAMTCAFYDYLVARTGNRAIIAELAAAFHNGYPLDQWILARTGHRDVASGIDALDADFLGWIASDARYGGSSSLRQAYEI